MKHHIFHDFDKWKITVEDTLIAPMRDGHRGIIGFYIKQERICKVCGYKEIDIQTKTI